MVISPSTTKSEASDRDEWVTVQEASHFTAYHPEYIRQLTRAGTVMSRKIATTILVSRASLTQYKLGMDAMGSKRFSKRLAKERQQQSQHKPQVTPKVELVAAAERIAESHASEESELHAKNLAVIQFLDALASATGQEAVEQQAVGRELVKKLDADRLSSRKLFPTKLRGKR